MMIENFCDEIVVHFSESIFQVNKRNNNNSNNNNHKGM